ncbi:flavin-containing amine oxidase-like protein [Aaosphaeria arxii CBS 175.79]|uniref:Flavin-containing amine oxidase-like protein n=1 Tax=Aaosphaeria arxii CBS 175.79 TaxID=1450172 RepID=A0A6A5Y9B5_9PLEO|nr:flavin-containing amine oxidase-like protein [Aaosphaeria arxii CBS 175.79]KAF2022192.1 flavin-containing amine oxidase-like protein [Aaosphaeria arxii CBS 175.79]
MAGPSERRGHMTIIGAGMAGLRAADVLLDHGFEVTLLEARQRLGGRILTDRSGGTPVDMGAAWMHGTAYNPLVKLIRALHIQYYYDDGTPLYYTEFGPSGSQFKARNVVDEFIDYIEHVYDTAPDADDRSALDFMREFLQNHELITDDERMWAPEAFREMENTLGLRMEEASSKFFKYALPPQRDLYVKGGYDTIVQWTEDKIKSKGGIIKLAHNVDRITHHEHQPVTIFGQADNTAFSLTADAVVVTIPLACLQSENIVFEPSLSRELEKGFESLSYGALGKVVLEFEDVFWSRQNDQLLYCPTPPQLGEDSELSEWPVLGHAFDVINLHIFDGSKKLCVLISPPLVQELEAMQDEKWKIYEYLEPLLELFRTEPYKALPKMVDLKITSWTQDPLAGYGAYSTMKVGDNPRVLEAALKANKKHRVQFAGEHCSLTEMGCVHGAYITGEIAAQNIVQLLKSEATGLGNVE